MTSKRQAQANLARLRETALNFQAALTRFIADESWLPLGYDTLAEFWQAEMSDFPLTTAEGKASVVYAMVDDGATDSNIAATVKGLGPQSVKTLRRQKGNGVPAPYATIVRQHYRKPPGATRSVHVMLSDRDYGAFVRLAEQKGLTIPKCAEVAILSFLDRKGE